ncbi:grfa protein [Lentinula edodes]|uniref:Grfa protein n=1 Tax=Lentinula edodes TaxID=5353 RepID=A0A1Q3EQ79_LENED|nr:grfa protein [Lentinula edodes]
MESSWMISDKEIEEGLRSGRSRVPVPPEPPSRNPLLRSASAGGPLFRSDSLRSHSFSRPTKSMHAQLPDPSTYPDPYPSRNTPYAVSSAESSTASTRSSAYTSFGSTINDLAHVHILESDDLVGLGITSDSVVQLLGGDTVPGQSRAPIDQTRWSDLYSSGARSRSSSVASNHPVEHAPPKLREQSSYDMSWSTVDERDEVGISEDETDDDHLLTEDDFDDELGEEERTSAVIVAEEGLAGSIWDYTSPHRLIYHAKRDALFSD